MTMAFFNSLNMICSYLIFITFIRNIFLFTLFNWKMVQKFIISKIIACIFILPLKHALEFHLN